MDTVLQVARWIVFLICLSASMAIAGIHPDNSGISFDYYLDSDTATFQLESDSVIQEFWLSEHSDSSIVLIECLVDGMPVVPLEEEDAIYPGMNCKRFVIQAPLQSIRLRYTCKHLTNKMNWVATAPAFAILGNINPPVQVRWIEH